MREVPPEDWSWVNAAADRFERDWKQGRALRIEDYLAEVSESRRDGSWTSCCGSRARTAPGMARNRLLKSTDSASRSMPRRSTTSSARRRDRLPDDSRVASTAAGEPDCRVGIDSRPRVSWPYWPRRSARSLVSCSVIPRPRSGSPSIQPTSSRCPRTPADTNSLARSLTGHGRRPQGPRPRPGPRPGHQGAARRHIRTIPRSFVGSSRRRRSAASSSTRGSCRSMSSVSLPTGGLFSP